MYPPRVFPPLSYVYNLLTSSLISPLFVEESFLDFLPLKSMPICSRPFHRVCFLSAVSFLLSKPNLTHPILLSPLSRICNWFSLSLTISVHLHTCMHLRINLSYLFSCTLFHSIIPYPAGLLVFCHNCYSIYGRHVTFLAAFYVSISHHSFLHFHSTIDDSSLFIFIFFCINHLSHILNLHIMIYDI